MTAEAPKPSKLESGQPSFDSALRRWLGEGQVDDAAAVRTRQHWLAQQLADEATLAGVLSELAEANTPVVLSLAIGRTLRTSIVAVGTDVIACVGEAGDRDGPAHLLVPIDQLLRVESGADNQRLPAGTSAPTASLAMWILLAMLADDRPECLIHLTNGTLVSGTLRHAGVDHVVINEGLRSIVVPLRSVALFSLR